MSSLENIIFSAENMFQQGGFCMFPLLGVGLWLYCELLFIIISLIFSNEDLDKIQRRLRWTTALAGAAVLLGLLGTVMGLSDTFSQNSSTSSADGVAQALISTRYGLALSLPALGLEGVLARALDKSRYKKRLEELKTLSNLKGSLGTSDTSDTSRAFLEAGI